MEPPAEDPLWHSIAFTGTESTPQDLLACDDPAASAMTLPETRVAAPNP